MIDYCIKIISFYLHSSNY